MSTSTAPAAVTTPRGPLTQQVAHVAVGLVALPVHLGVALARITLGAGELLAPEGAVRRRGGWADQLAALLGEDGMVGKLDAMSRDPESPLGRVAALSSAAAPDRPLGRALAPGGMLDRVLGEEGPLTRLLSDGGAVERLLAQGGTLDRLLVEDGPLERLVAPDGPLDRLTREGGVLESVLAEGGLVERLLEDHGFVEKLVAEGGTLDQLVALGPILSEVHPGLEELVDVLPQLHEAIESIGVTVGPLSDLANRIPGGRRRSVAAVDS